MKKIVLLITIIFAAASLKAQNEFQQITLGAGAGAATTYASSQIAKTTPAFSANLSYYPKKFFNIALEAQVGELAGGNAGMSNASYTNKYAAVIFEPTFHFGAIFNNSFNNLQGDFVNKSGYDFASVCKNFYVGTGFGLIHNNVTNIDQTTSYSQNIVAVVPVKFGYEISFADQYDNPMLKLNLSYSFNSALGRGLDGSSGPAPQAAASYSYYSLQLEFPIYSSQNHGMKRR